MFVSGTIGDAALGLRIRLGTLDAMPAGGSADHLLDRYLHPQPRVELAPVIRRFATASLDVSDGLVGDFAHICKQSGVGGEIDAACRAAVGRGEGAGRGRSDRRSPRCSPAATTTRSSPRCGQRDADAFAEAAAEAGVPVTRIGRVVEGRGRRWCMGPDGPIRLGHFSHTHF